MDLLAVVSKSGPGAASRPAPDRVLAGDPVMTVWETEGRGALSCGLWHCTPGKWRVHYDEWEYCRIVEGLSVITEEGGAARILRAGDAVIIRPGFRGTWEVIEATLKDYVVLDPPPAGL
jgi:uncharacterized cupin superfamily protein